MPVDPVTASLIAGSASQSAGSMLGGLFGASGGISTGDLVLPTFDAQSDPGLSAAQFDALNLLGFGNPLSVAGPMDSLINRINSTTTDEKTKRRALNYVRSLQKAAASGGDLSMVDKYGKGRLGQIISRLGLTHRDVKDTLAQQQEFDARQKLLANRLGPLNEDTILGRAQAAAASGRLLGAAGAFASGDAPNAFQKSLLDRIDRNIADQREQLMLQAQFGGFNPSAGLEGIQRMTQDRELTALTQAVQAASALTQGLAQGNQLAQSAAGLNSGAALNSLGLAAQQAMAANHIAQQSSINRADSLANGISGAFGGVGQSLGLGAVLANDRAIAGMQNQPNLFGNTYIGSGSPGFQGYNPTGFVPQLFGGR